MFRRLISLSDDRTAEFRWLVPLAACVLMLHLTAVLTLKAFGATDAGIMAAYAKQALLATPSILIIGLAVMLLRLAVLGEKQPFEALIRSLRTRFPDWASIITPIVLLSLMPILFCAQGMLKMLIPLIVGFTADNLFSHVDETLFFGVAPWKITHAILGTEATLVIDRAYTFWLHLLGIAIAYFALCARGEDRARFFITFVAIWIVLGLIGAYIGSSVGPILLPLLGSPEAGNYTGLIARLNMMDAELGGTPRQHVLNALNWQNALWDGYQTRQFSFGMGISAMPSMHVSVAMLYALSARRIGRIPFAAAIAFLAIIIVGSIHLGWHYAADGLVGIIGTVTIWLAVERYLRWSGIVPGERVGTPRFGAAAGAA